MKDKSFRVSLNNMIIFLQLLPFFVPLGLVSEYKIFKLFWYSYLVCSMEMVLFKIIKQNSIMKYRKIGFLALFLGLYVLAQCYSTVLHNGNWVFTLFKAFYLILLCASFQNCILANTEGTLKILDFILLISILISTFCHMFGIFNPDGDYVSVYISLPVWLIVRIIRNIKKGDRFDFSLFTVSCFSILSTIINVENGVYGDASYEWTFFVEIIIICTAYFFRKVLYRFRKVCNVSVLFGTIIALNLIFVVFQLFSRIGILKFILIEIMHKDITFTGRTGIWNLAMSIISRSPIWGYGESMAGFVSDGSKWNVFIVVHGAHNQFLEIILLGGIVSLIFYLLAFGIIWKKLIKDDSTIAMFVSIGLFSILLELSFVYRQILMCTPLFILMIIAMNIKLIYGGKQQIDKKFMSYTKSI